MMLCGRLVEAGTPLALEAHLGPKATLDEVFVKLTESNAETTGGQTRESACTRD